VKRLPDHKSLEDSRDLLLKEKQGWREDYAKGVLTMFTPFREKIYLVAVGETWWGAYQHHRKRHGMPTNWRK
jgi:hypothetical protein